METEYDIYKGFLRESIGALASPAETQDEKNWTLAKMTKDFNASLADFTEFSPAITVENQIEALQKLQDSVNHLSPEVIEENSLQSNTLNDIRENALNVLREFNW